MATKVTVFFFLHLISTSWCYYGWNDVMGRTEKTKVIKLSEDLFKDSMLKLRQILEIRQEHEEYIAYNVGMIFGRIREKYRFMYETYREIKNKYNERLKIKPPGQQTLRTVHFIIALEMMHYLSVEIDKLIDVLEETATEDLRGSNFLIKKAPPPPPAERSGPERLDQYPDEDPDQEQSKEKAEISRIAREEVWKSKLREQYLMKKIGQPNATTTVKRFYRQWPVEQAWELNKYTYD